MAQRTLFSPADVFLSWNNRDREWKDRLAAWIRSRGYSVWESDYECSGSIKDACLAHIPLCKVFVILLTENSLQSQWVKDELDGALAMEDGVNRIVPVVMDRAIIDQKRYGVLGDSLARLFANPDDAHNVSAVVAEGMTPAALEEKLLKNVRDLCLNRGFRVYTQNLGRAHLSVPILVNVGAVSAAGDLGRLYIPRRLKTAGSAPEEGSLTEGEFLARPGHAVIIGSGGSGKSQYLSNMAALACRETEDLVFRISCAELARTKESLADHLFREFSDVVGDSNYERHHFDALLAHKKDRLLLLFDGLDEIISDGDFEHLRKTAERFLDAHPNARMVFTTRNRKDADRMILGARTAEAFLLERFSEEDIHSYARKLFIAFDDADRGERFYMDLASIDEEIKGNPLLVSQLAVIYADSGRLPGTVVEIFDIITELVTTAIDTRHDFLTDFAAGDRELLERVPDVLRELAYRKYRKYADAEIADNLGLVSDILEQYGEPRTVCHGKAKKLLNYLERRAILYRSEFAHKMFLEYFAAVYLYEACFNGSGEVRDKARLDVYLQTHYHEPYWENVTELLLAKADCLCAKAGLTALYHIACEAAKGDYDLLFKVLRIQRRRDVISGLLLGDILSRTLDGEFGPYGQLFCYIPRENLYREFVNTAGTLWTGLTEEKRFVLLSLLRDVCYIFGGYTGLEELTDRKSARIFQLFARKLPESPRAALNVLFCGVRPNWLDAYVEAQNGSRVYPFFFNVHAVATTDGKGFGKYPLVERYEDELGLYGETEPDGEGRYWGLVSLPYDKDWLEQELSQDYAPGMTGLILLPSAEPVLEPLSIANTRLELLMLPSTITELGRYSLAYYGIHAENGIRILMEHGPTEIQRENGLKYAGTIRHLHLPESVVTLERGVFRGCSNLVSIVIPGAVSEISEYAFSYCGSLTAVRIPDSVTAIGISAFEECVRLWDITIPNGVKTIEAGAFQCCKNIASACLPDGVTEIGRSAFRDCTSLAEVKVPKDITHIAYGTFAGCTGLRSVELPEGLVEIGEHAFSGCASLKSVNIPSSVRKLRKGAFGKCASLEAVEISGDIEQIEMDAFLACSALRKVSLTGPIQKIQTGIFARCTALTELTLPDSVTEIGDYAFAHCEALREVRLPASLGTIGIQAFSDCVSLTGVEIPAGVRVIRSAAFAGCTALERVELPMGLREIYEMAFTACTSLASIEIPETVTEVGNAAFRGCTALTKIVVPAQTGVGEAAFEGCPGIPAGGRPYKPLDDYMKILFGSREEYEATLASREHRLEVHIDGADCPDGILTGEIVERLLPKQRFCRVTVGDGVERISEDAFAAEMFLTEVTISDQVRQIGTGAFRFCGALERVSLPRGLTEIVEKLFWRCGSLKEVVLPDCVERIGHMAFSECGKLIELKLPASLKEIGSCAFYKSGIQSVKVPEGITGISEEAFSQCAGLQTAVLPESLTEIGTQAFVNCAALTTVNFLAGIVRIGDNAFCDCGSLTDVSLPEGLEELGQCVFQGCVSLTEVVIPKGLKRSGRNIFIGCEKLASVTIPDGITAIPDNAFCQCDALTCVVIPGSVDVVGADAFADCISLRTVEIMPGVRKIDDFAFAGCDKLTEIVLPDSVTILGMGVFCESGNLSAVRLPEGLREIGDEVFCRCAALEEIEIPQSVTFISPTAFEGCELRRVVLSVRFRDKVNGIFGSYREIREWDEDPELIEVHF